MGTDGFFYDHKNATLMVMNFLKDADELDRRVSGVVDAYLGLRDIKNFGIYTSNGQFYNHTLFGRDAAMSAKFVSDFDQEVSHSAIVALAELQGTTSHAKTGEALGRIIHEHRHLDSWRGTWLQQMTMHIAGWFWGVTDSTITTYFAIDTTALYIRLVHKYFMHIDAHILEQTVRIKGTTVTIGETVERAVEWMITQTDEYDCICLTRTNKTAHPYGTFEDSVSSYAWADRSAINFKHPISFVEVQAYTIDALQDAAYMLPLHSSEWKKVAAKMTEALLRDFWDEDQQCFASTMSYKNHTRLQSDVPNLSAGWTLNNSFWDDLPEMVYQEKLSGIIRRLFADDFLTAAGIRTRSMNYPEPLGTLVDYHGSQTVWPMFTFMFIEGLRRHGLFRLAEQLENRLINAANAVGFFQEFYIIDHDQKVFTPSADPKARKLPIQFPPEAFIAFTVVPMMVLAYRRNNKEERIPEASWKRSLEDDILQKIPHIDRVEPKKARDQFEIIPVRFTRFTALAKTALYYMKQSMTLR